MDRMKYRIWDKKTKKYLPQDDLVGLTCNGLAILIMPDGNVYQEVLHKDFVVEQCTGVKDKHGHLIYAGDIITAGISGDVKCVVFWDDGLPLGWRVKPVKKKGRYCSECLMGSLEIVGNIHE